MSDQCTVDRILMLCRKLLGDFTAVLSAANSSVREVATAVRGIGELAAPTLKFFGQQVWFCTL